MQISKEFGKDTLSRISAYIAENPKSTVLTNDDDECIETEAYLGIFIDN